MNRNRPGKITNKLFSWMHRIQHLCHIGHGYASGENVG